MSAELQTAHQEPLVSVVTPVYNGERHLRGCIESVLAQTYIHWDYAIVNNKSTDRTIEIAREYAARDPRIRVVDNEAFVRVIENHNNAFRQVSPLSKYCKVVAADDRLLPECLEKMVRLAEENPRVAIVGAYGIDGTKVIWQGVPYPTSVVPGRELCRSWLLGSPYVFGSPTAVLYRSDIVRSRHAFYNAANLHADSEACLEFLESNDFGFVHQVLTFQGAQGDTLSAMSRRIQTYLPRYLYELEKYGPKYLDGEELKERIRSHLHEYYWYLGEQLYMRRGKEFWSFHREKLASLDHPLSRLRLAASAAMVAVDVLLNPKKSLGALVRRLRKRSSSTGKASIGSEGNVVQGPSTTSG
jgi:glycosyltransferase involved in cell wall biosynthesis